MVINAKIGLTILVLALLIGCSENSYQPAANTQYDVTSDAATLATTIDNELSLAKTAGISVDSSKAVFSLNWRELINMRTQTTALIGRAMAIAFSGPKQQGPPFAPAGIDMGSVYLNYNGNHVELLKRTNPRGGITYSTFTHRRDSVLGTNVEFVPSGSYEFEVTGSTDFTAFKASITAPPGLLKFTGVIDGQSISKANDLTLSWQGGNANEPILLTVMVPKFRMMGSGPMGPGRHGGSGPMNLGGTPPIGGMHNPRGGNNQGGEIGPCIGDPPLPIDSTKAIIIKLDTNPGTYTISASQLQTLVSSTNATQIHCMISQLTVNRVDHSGEVVRLVIGNNDQARLLIQ